MAYILLSPTALIVHTQHSHTNLPADFGFRWIQIDDNAGALALEFGASGVYMLAVRKARPTEPTMSYWLDEQGKMLGRIEVGLA